MNIAVKNCMLEQRISSALVSPMGSKCWGIFTNPDALKALATLLYV